MKLRNAYNRTACVLGLLGTTSLIILSGAAHAQAADPGEEPDSRRLGTVTVTAQKREQNLQDVPISITAVDQDFLQSRDVSTIDSLNSLAPNLKIETVSGNATAAQISIRGGVTINPALTWEPTVGIYQNGVYFGKTQGALFDIADIERVEVLRGPQGTLYGRNTLAGAINIVTRKPSGEFGGYLQAGVGNYGATELKGTLDFDQIGPFRVKLSGMTRSRDGFADVIENPFPEVTTAGTPSQSEVGTLDRKAGRIDIQFEPTDYLTIDYGFDYSDVDQKVGLNQLVSVGEGNIFDPASPFYVGGGPIGGLYYGFPLDLYVETGRLEEISIDAPSFERQTVKGHSLTAAWDLGWGELKSITGFRDLEWQDSLDLDGSPLPIAHTRRISEYETFSQEFQLTGSTDSLTYTAGLYYFTDEGETENPQSFFGGANVYDSYSAFETTAYAAYGQLEWALTDRFTVTGGVRYNNEEKSIDRFLQIVADPPITLVPEGTTASETFDSFTPTLILAYDLAEDLNAYAKYSRGYKSGGFNGEASSVAEVTRPYDAETVDSFEIGLKSVLFDGRLRLNTAIFNNTHQDMQLSIFTAENAASSDIRNAGEATIRGLEVEAAWQVSDAVTLGLNYGYLDAEYDEFIELGENVADNRAFPHAPENTFAATLDATLWSGGIGTLILNADYQYSDSYFVFPFSLDRNDPQNAYLSGGDSRGIVNVRLALADIPLSNGVTGELSLWGKNITDEEYRSNAIDFGPGFGSLVVANFGAPATYGVRLRADF